MFMLKNERTLKIVICTLLIIGLIMILIGIASMVIGMLIDHECYQLQPNEFYNSSICEKYWKPINGGNINE